MSELVRFVGVFVSMVFVSYILMKIINMCFDSYSKSNQNIEGFTMDDLSAATTTSTDSATASTATTAASTATTAAGSPSGIAGGATSLAATIKANTVKLEDSLLIPKYRKDYENVIINLEEFINMALLTKVLTIKEPTKEDLALMSSSLTSIQALNTIMRFLDSRK
jgi:hypothetical protein